MEAEARGPRPPRPPVVRTPAGRSVLGAQLRGRLSRLRPLRALLGMLAFGLVFVAPSAPAAAQTTCREAVQGKVPRSHGGSTRWSTIDLARLCGGAPGSTEPARCFRTVMNGEVDYGGGHTSWNPQNAMRLCAGTRDAPGLLRCFRQGIDGGTGWQAAISECRQRERDGDLPATSMRLDRSTVAKALQAGGGGPDADGDGHASAATGGDDCDDSDANRYPGNTEVGDTRGHDEDCDPTTIAAARDDRDGDGFFPDRIYNVAADGSRNAGRDCDDSDPSVSPHGQEVCNGVDDDCDGNVDEGLLATVFRDGDGDLYGDPSQDAKMCFFQIRSPWVLNGTDCNDKDPSVNPGTGTCGI